MLTLRRWLEFAIRNKRGVRTIRAAQLSTSRTRRRREEGAGGLGRSARRSVGVGRAGCEGRSIEEQRAEEGDRPMKACAQGQRLGRVGSGSGESSGQGGRAGGDWIESDPGRGGQQQGCLRQVCLRQVHRSRPLLQRRGLDDSRICL